MKSLMFTLTGLTIAKRIAFLSTLLIFGLSGASTLEAQCSLTCGDRQLSVNGSCEAEITPAHILTDNPLDASCEYRVVIKDLDDNPIVSSELIAGMLVHPTISLSDGSIFKASVEYTDANGDVFSCWSYLTLEDKLPPIVSCLEDVTVACTKSHSDELNTSTTQCHIAEQTEDLNADADFYDFSLDLENEALPWELITSASFELDFTGNPASFNATLLGPDGESYAASYTQANGLDLSALEGLQATSTRLSGTWNISINSSAVSDITNAEFCITSNSLFADSPDLSDNCSEASVDFLFDQLNDMECEGQSDPICAYERVISYRTVDASGNFSPACNFTICYNKPSVLSADFVFPPNVELECDLEDDDGDGMPDSPYSSWDLNENGYPDPSDVGVGYPSIDGEDLIPGEDNLCKISVAYTDNQIDICDNGAAYKIIRTWTILDWCESTSRTWIQTVKYSDNQPPFLVCPPDTLTFTASGNNCTTNVVFDPLSTTDDTGVQFLFDCSAVTFEVEYLLADERDVDDVDQAFNPTIDNGDGTFTAPNIPTDTFWVKYIATDGCGNATECRFEAFIKDNTVPYAICDQFTAVALSEDGWARANAISFDDGSYDACSDEVSFKVRRLNTPCSSEPDYEGNDTQFGDFVQFCCGDLGSEYVQVELQVTDASGNTNTCVVNVEVQDKFGPEVQSCPQDVVTINCTEYSDTELFGFPNAPVVTANTCSAGISVQFEDNADIDGQCNTGTVTRRWFYTINNEKFYLDECEQTLIINSDFNNDIDFPGDIDIDCSEISTTTGVPTINGNPVTDYNGCANFAYTSEDQRFYNVDGICFKILRRHTVIDWCAYVPNSGSTTGYYSETQVIKVSNTAPATIQECADEVSQTLDETTCMNSVRLNVPWGYDECLEQPILPHDMAYNVVSFGQIVEEVASISTTDGTITLQPLPKGVHRVNFFIYNSCNNPPATCTLDVVIDETDTIKPIPYCLGGITTVLMTQLGESLPGVEIWASDFDLGSTDNCTDQEDLVFTFENGSSFMDLGCEDEGLMTLRIYVTDECGNSDFCETSINIQANGIICDTVVVDSTDFDPNNSRINIAGSIFTENSEMVDGVDVVLNDMNTGSMEMIETLDGSYLFDDVLSDDEYMIQAENDVDYLNGVSTLDIVLIQKHILGISQLDSPYKIIAADANNSESISAVDLIQIRKLILGIYNELPSNDSWRFVDSKFVFSNPSSPWPFVESISLNEMSEDEMNNDFIAVKVGDVNNNVILSNVNAENVESRSVKTIEIKNQEFSKGDLVSINLQAEFDDVIGLQFAFNYDFHMLEFVGIDSNKFTVSENNYSMENPGLVLFSWNDYKARSFKNALTIEFVAKVDGSVSNSSLSFVNEVLNAEMYNNDHEISKLNLQVEGNLAEKIDQLRLLQNKPNPFSDITNIGFYLPKDGNATISIIDLSGKLIYKNSAHYQKGFNELNINSNEITASGLLYYQLDTKYGTETKKMLLIK